MGATAAFALQFNWQHLATFGTDLIFFTKRSRYHYHACILGEWVEHKSVAATQTGTQQTGPHQKLMANMIAFDEKHKEIIFPVENTAIRN